MIDGACRAAFRLASIGLAAGWIGLQPAWGYDNKSGIHWLRMCTSPEPNGQIECAVYVRALVEYDALHGKVLAGKRSICPDKSVTIGATHRIVVDYLRGRPDELQQPFALLAHRALVSAFPCPGDAQTGAGAPPPGQR